MKQVRLHNWDLAPSCVSNIVYLLRIFKKIQGFRISGDIGNNLGGR